LKYLILFYLSIAEFQKFLCQTSEAVMKALVLQPQWSNVLALRVTKAFPAKSVPLDIQGHLRAFIWDFVNLVNVSTILQFAILRQEFAW
jgi:hypothetical protein